MRFVPPSVPPRLYEVSKVRRRSPQPRRGLNMYTDFCINIPVLSRFDQTRPREFMFGASSTWMYTRLSKLSTSSWASPHRQLVTRRETISYILTTALSFTILRSPGHRLGDPFPPFSFSSWRTTANVQAGTDSTAFLSCFASESTLEYATFDTGNQGGSAKTRTISLTLVLLVCL